MPTWVGDATLATPLLAAIRARHPDAVIDLLLKPHLVGLLRQAPYVSALLVLTKDRSPARLARRIAAGGYDWGLLLSNSFRPALLMWLGRVRRRVGYARNARGPLLTDRLSVPRPRGAPYRMVDYYGALGAPLGLTCLPTCLTLNVTPEQQHEAAALFDAFDLDGAGPVVGLNPGASFGDAKRWPAAHFAAAADALVRAEDARIVVLAGPGEDELARSIVAQMTAHAVALPSTRVGLDTLKGVIQRLDLLISNDTGPRHFAAALDVPVITLFGPTHRTWGDCGYPKMAELTLDLECGPCMARVCPLKHHKCMTDLQPATVVAAAVDLLRRYHGRP